MKKIVKEIIPAREEYEKEIETYYCDLCGEEIKNPSYASAYDEQGKVIYNVEYYNFGNDGGSDINYCFDLCNECIKNKVFPLIEKELKIKPRYDKRIW